MEKKDRDNFDDFARDYRQQHAENIRITGADSYHFARAKVLQVRRLESGTPLSILDLGCGDGVVDLYLREAFPSSAITGIDVSDKSIQVARGLGLERVDFRVYNGNDIPFGPQSFDLVFLGGVLHHVEGSQQLRILQEIYRVLKSQGRLYVFEHNPYNPATRYLVKTCVFDRHARLLRASRVRRMLSDCGFGVRITRYTSFIPLQPFFNFMRKLEDHLGWLPMGAQYFIQAVK